MLLDLLDTDEIFYTLSFASYTRSPGKKYRTTVKIITDWEPPPDTLNSVLEKAHLIMYRQPPETQCHFRNAILSFSNKFFNLTNKK